MPRAPFTPVENLYWYLVDNIRAYFSVYKTHNVIHFKHYFQLQTWQCKHIYQIYSEQVIRNSLVSEQLQLALTVKQLKYIFETILK